MSRLEGAERLALALAAAWLLGGALLRPPVVVGDAGEYALMTASLARHLSPDARPADVRAVAAEAAAHGAPVNFVYVLQGYFEGAGARQYSYHFWGYSLLALPARLALRAVGADPFKAHVLTNVACLLAALWGILGTGALDRASRHALFALSLLSPALPFLRWPHPEVFTFSMVTLALLWNADGRPARAILAAALGAAQNPPLVWLVAALWLLACRRAVGSASRSRHAGPQVLRLTAAGLPALLPPAFFYWTFGTPSVIVRESTSWSNLSLGRALELFLDLNIGMLPYLPFTLALFLAAVLAGLVGRRSLRTARLAGLLLVLALSCSLTGNWNHGTCGPSRYVIWMLPLVFLGVLALRANAPELGARTHAILLGLAIVSQAAITLARGGISAPPDYLQHSYAARSILDSAPGWYNPSPEIFVARTVHRTQPVTAEPVVYGVKPGCRKALVRPEDLEWLQSACGFVPSGQGWFASTAERDRGWQYVDYDPLPAGAPR